MIVDGLHPALPLILGSLLLAVLPHRARQVWLVLLPVLSLWHFQGVEPATSSWLGLKLKPVAAEKINVLFGTLFHLAAIIAAIYTIHVRDRLQLVAGTMYAGAAVGVAVAGDWLTLFVFWELLAVTSVFLIWARKSSRSGGSGMRYLLFHILSGVLLLAGAAAIYADSGELYIGSLTSAGGTIRRWGPWLVFFALGIKCAFPFLHTWLVDAYPEATPTGTVFLSAFTTKAAVCVLAQTFAGVECLVWIGTAMAMFPIFYAVIENDLRRVLGYSMINQIGFMVVGIGIGSALSINGAVAHAFNDVLFKGLLFMSMGAVLHRTGRINGSDLGGLYKSMPLTMVFCIIGAASISAFPLFSGFVSKSMVMTAAAEAHLTIVWLALLFAAAGVFHHAGIKIPFFAFFAHDSGIRCKEAPWNMLLAMGMAAFLCLFNGIAPNAFLYPMLPAEAAYEPYTAAHVITQTQLLFFSALAFTVLMLTRVYPPELRSVNLDVDWLYRRAGAAIRWVSEGPLNAINRSAHRVIVDKGLAALGCFFAEGPSRLMAWCAVPWWKMRGRSAEEIEQGVALIHLRGRRAAFPIGITACLAILLLTVLFAMSYVNGRGG